MASIANATESIPQSRARHARVVTRGCSSALTGAPFVYILAVLVFGPHPLLDTLVCSALGLAALVGLASIGISMEADH